MHDDESPREYRKRFAQWAVGEHKRYAPYLFALLDGRGITSLIYKHEFEDLPDDIKNA